MQNSRRSSALEKPSFEQTSRSSDTESISPILKPTFSIYAGIFLLSSSVLLFELSLTRIFAVMLWSNLAFMVVSTALFGFGLSGVYLALRPDSSDPVKKLASAARYCLFSAMAIIGAYLVVSYIPFRMWQFNRHPEYFVSLAIWEISLCLPFFFAGVTIANCLGLYPRNSGSLYGVDLLGAALGSLLLLYIIPVVNGEGTVVVASLLALAASLMFSRPRQSGTRIAAALLIAAFAIILPRASSLMPIRFHQSKRHFAEDQRNDAIFATRWSSLSRVDIGEDTKSSGPLKGHETRAIWIDGGTNESVMLRTDGGVNSVAPMDWLTIGVAHALKQNTGSRVLIIGAAGGRETLTALSFGAQHVDAVEMDPSIVHFVKEPEYAKYMGYVYQDPRVNLVNDEGRSFLRRQPAGSYDIIQSVNNYTPVAMAAGALNLSETFLITKEAFHDYLNHLAPDGILAFHRGATLRVALTAIAAMRELGIEHPEKHLLIANGEYEANQVFLLKKSEWTEAEVLKAHNYLDKLNHFGDKTFLWVPVGEHRTDLFMSNVIGGTPEAQRAFYSNLGLNLAPSTDDKPFIEHFLRFGHQTPPPGAPPEFIRRNNEKWMGIIPRGDFPYIAILTESALLALLFVGAPLVFWARKSRGAEGFLGIVGYFAALGFSFIVIEICLMKQYVMFLGHPAYSITTILVTLLCGAGIGSLLTENFTRMDARKAAALVIAGLTALLLVETAAAPYLFERYLGLELSGRIFVSALMLFPLGVLMGMPFPLGLRLIDELHHEDGVRREFVAWAWGINGYTTVIGSTATVFIALQYGFHAALIIAAAGYVLGLLTMLLGTRRLA